MTAVLKQESRAQTIRRHVDMRLQSLRTDRYSWWVHWMDLAKYILPRRYKWLITTNQGNRGSPINQGIIDSTGTMAARTLASGMMSGITSPGRTWFRLSTGDADADDNPDVKLWLTECQNRMMRVFAESNFYMALATLYFDLAVFGTGVMLIYEDADDIIRCYNPCAGEYFLANGPRLNVDCFYREFVMTADQVAREFGLANASDTVKGLIRTGGAALVQEVIIGHAIEPNT